jgi:uncharacterized membrane protein (DUF373 family)
MQMRRWINRVEDMMYIAIGAVLAIAAVVLLGWAALSFFQSVSMGNVGEAVLRMLDTLLLALMIIEIMHTVRISIGSRSLAIEPFLVVGLIASVRRVLIITAEQATPSAEHMVEFQMAMLELGLLTFMILALVGAIYWVRRFSSGATRESDTSGGQQRSEQGQSPEYIGQPGQ